MRRRVRRIRRQPEVFSHTLSLAPPHPLLTRQPAPHTIFRTIPNRPHVHLDKSICIIHKCKGTIEHEAVFGNLSPAQRSIMDAGAARAHKRGREEMNAELQPELQRLRLSTMKKTDMLMAKMTEVTSTKCGNCSQYFVDFTGCMVIQCYVDDRGAALEINGLRYCGHYTCGWCFEAIGNDDLGAHNHVRVCPKNAVRDRYYCTVIAHPLDVNHPSQSTMGVFASNDMYGDNLRQRRIEHLAKLFMKSARSIVKKTLEKKEARTAMSDWRITADSIYALIAQKVASAEPPANTHISWRRAGGDDVIVLDD